jgi:hypothetical protein
VFIKKPGGEQPFYATCEYRLTSIADWGTFSHWHATVCKADTTAAGGGRPDSTAILFDSGTISGQGAYLGTASYLRNPNADGFGILERDLRMRYATDAADTLAPGIEDWIGGAYYFESFAPGAAVANYNTGTVSPERGIYEKIADTSVGVYRWYWEHPIYFTTRFRASVAPAVDAFLQARAVSFWYSAN